MQRPALNPLLPCPPLGVYLSKRTVTTWGNPVKVQAVGPIHLRRDEVSLSLR